MEMTENNNENSLRGDTETLSDAETRLKDALLQKVQKHSLATLDQLRDEVDELASLNIK
jgi:hypothetical protein